MATTADPAPSQALLSLREDRWTLAFGLLWATVLLALLTAWIGVKYWEVAMPVVLGVGALGVLTLGLFLWQIWPLHWIGSQEEPVLRRRRGILGYALLGLSVVLLLLMFWLTLQEGLPAFPEVSGAVLLAVVGAVAGLRQRRTPDTQVTQEHFLESLIRNRKPLAIGLLVLSVLLFATNIWLYFTYGWRAVLPELAGFELLSLILLAAGLALLLAPSGPLSTRTLVYLILLCVVGLGVVGGLALLLVLSLRIRNLTTNAVRILVLLTGGLTGLVLALMIALRVYLWWGELFSSGIRSWQEEGVWRLWLVIYVELLGLAIMFGSLLLAYADIRTSAAMRRLLYGYNTVLTGLLLLAILVVLNILVYASYPYTFDWTQSRGLYSLSPKSKNTLENLKDTATVYVLLSPNLAIYNDTRNLLDNAQAYNGRLQVEYLSPDRDANRYRELLKKYPKLQQARNDEMSGGRGLLLVYGPESEAKLPHVFIPASRLFEQKQDFKERKEVFEYKGEDVLMTELRFLADNQRKPVVYFTQGNDELDIRNSTRGDPTGAGLLVEKLKHDNYEVRGLFWGAAPKGLVKDESLVFTKKAGTDAHELPRDAKVLVIAQPKAKFAKDVLEALGKYMQDGGKLIVLVNPTVDEESFRYIDLGLEEFLKSHAVVLSKDFLLRYPEKQNDNPLASVAAPPPNSANPIALSFKSNRFLLLIPRTVRPAPHGAAFNGQVLLQVNPRGSTGVWAETEPRAMIEPLRYIRFLEVTNKLDEKIGIDPLPVAVAVTDQAQKPRLVVFGDGYIASNLASQSRVPYYEMLTSSMEWLAERPGNIGIGPKKTTSYALRTQEVNTSRMVWLPLGLMMLGLVGLGTGVWVVRRR